MKYAYNHTIKYEYINSTNKQHFSFFTTSYDDNVILATMRIAGIIRNSSRCFLLLILLFYLVARNEFVVLAAGSFAGGNSPCRYSVQ